MSISICELKVSGFMAKSEAAPSKHVCEEFDCSPSEWLCDLDFASVSSGV